jgi:hypothetical protein
MNCYGLTVNETLVNVTDPNRITVVEDCNVFISQKSGNVVIAWTSVTRTIM